MQRIYSTAADPGLHAASEWLLRHMEAGRLAEKGERRVGEGQERDKRLEEIKRAVAKEKESRRSGMSTARVKRWW